MWTDAPRWACRRSSHSLCCSSSQGAPLSRLPSDYGSAPALHTPGLPLGKTVGKCDHQPMKGHWNRPWNSKVWHNNSCSQELLSKYLHTFLPMEGREFLDVSHKQDASLTHTGFLPWSVCMETLLQSTRKSIYISAHQTTKSKQLPFLLLQNIAMFSWKKTNIYFIF